MRVYGFQGFRGLCGLRSWRMRAWDVRAVVRTRGLLTSFPHGISGVEGGLGLRWEGRGYMLWARTQEAALQGFRIGGLKVFRGALS